MKPRSVTCTPHSARPMFSVFTARPAAISTVATSIFCVAPFASTSIVTLSFPAVQRLIGRDHGRLVDLQSDLRQALHPRSGRDQHRFLRLVPVVPDLHLAAGLEHAGAFHDRDLVLLHQELDALRVLVAHFAGTLHRDAVVGFDGPRFDAELFLVTQEPRDICGVEQRLGGNAADVDAYPAELLLLDHRGAHAQLGGPDGGDVAGRPPAQDDYVKLTRQKPPFPNAEVGTRNAEQVARGSCGCSAFRVPRSEFIAASPAGSPASVSGCAG